MRRGFKAEAERLAARTLAQVGARSDGPVDIRELATSLSVVVISAADLIDIAELYDLEALQSGSFSAATFYLPGDHIVAVYNPLNQLGRTNSDIAHELAHILLGHEVREVQRLAGHTFFTCDRDQEEEANWLAGCLLLPRPLLLHEAYAGADADSLAARYNVSPTMARFRLNTSGVLLQARRSRRLERPTA